MDYKASWIEMLTRGHWVINAQAEGLSHEDSLLQLPFRGNCFNWILGHLVVYRGEMLKLFNQAPKFSDEQKAIYERGSEAITDGGQAIDFHTLLALFNATQDQLVELINNAEESFWDEERESSAGKPYKIGARLAFFLWHESYHSGQTEFLRQLAGKDDQII